MKAEPSLTARMTALIESWERKSDDRSVFLRCYLLMTRNMLAAIDAGEFVDGQWVKELLHHFAEYYFKALRDYEQGSDRAPVVWRRVHDLARDGRGSVLQNMLLGVNAHINYDLVLTLVDLLEEEWSELDGVKRQERYLDHCRVNKVIQGTVDQVQDRVVETLVPTMNLIDLLMGPLDEWMISHLIRSWRDEVWDHAVQVLEAGDLQTRESKREQIEALTLNRAQQILLGDRLES